MKRVAAPLLVVAVLIGSATTLLAGEEKKADSNEKKKEAQPSKKEAPANPQVSPIYRAAQESGKGKPVDDSVVITNAELERMWAGLSPSERLQGVYQAERHIGAPAPGEAGAATASGEPQQGSADKKPEATAAAPKNIEELRAKVDELERRLLALRNPLLPRRYAERKDEQVENWDKMNNPERVAKTEEELKKAKDELAAAEREAGRSSSSPPR